MLLIATEWVIELCRQLLMKYQLQYGTQCIRCIYRNLQQKCGKRSHLDSKSDGDFHIVLVRSMESTLHSLAFVLWCQLA